MILVFGESLGTGVAVQLVANRPASALILDSPYSSIADVAASKFWWLPVRRLLSDQYDSLAHIAAVKAPIFVFQGDQDTIVPPELGKKLFAAARAPKKLVTLTGQLHTPALHGVWSLVEQFLDEHRAGARFGSN